LAQALSQVCGMSCSFASQPKPVANRKIRYRDAKETCITWDKRVYRGSNYSMTRIKEALEADESQGTVTLPVRRRRPNEKSLFEMGLPEPRREPIDLSANLVAKEEVVESVAVEAQTDEFLPEPPEEVPHRRTGIDISTQVEDEGLFNFDCEVEPILDVITNKTLEQAMMEIEEECELERMREFKVGWYQRQEAMMQDWQEQVAEEWARWNAKEELVRQKRAEKEREARVLLKVQAMAAAKAHLSHLVINAVDDMKQVSFPDSRVLSINRTFLPDLLGRVRRTVQGGVEAEHLVDSIIASSVRSYTRRGPSSS